MGWGEVSGLKMQTLDLRDPSTAVEGAGASSRSDHRLSMHPEARPSTFCLCFTQIPSFFSVLYWENWPRKRIQGIRLTGRAERVMSGFGTLTRSILLPITPSVVPAHFTLTSGTALITLDFHYSKSPTYEPPRCELSKM